VKIFILGVSGLIGSNIFDFLSRKTNHEVLGSYRTSDILHTPHYKFSSNLIHYSFEDSINELADILDALRPDIVVNAIGITKHIDEERAKTIRVNSIFPHQLAQISTKLGIRLVQISTDCVFSGKKGMYIESDLPDAADLYGRSKILGEVNYDKHLTVRISTIGKEIISKYGLLEWFLATENSCYGYKKAIFSGLPSKYFADVLNRFIFPCPEITGLYHISSTPIDKFTLLRKLATFYNKKIEIFSNDEFVIDRSLDSSSFANKTGYIAPSWSDLINAEWL
jgi:dTDP-4-dehydrorhamnose reductase